MMKSSMWISNSLTRKITSDSISIYGGCSRNELFLQFHIRNIRINNNPNLPLWNNQRKGLIKMVNIDCNYYINVAKLMQNKELSRPRKRLLIGDGEFLPIIPLEAET